ncbi:MAG: 3-phosphoshikimate 1-carboxyvinyltransferase [Clostridiales bacterium]|nr:3-phosphoshikimate 1-carboxyvinyltransferase [Clostridiales bacterium]
MNVKITPSKILGEITAPPSKSYAHRLLIAAYLSGERVRVKNAGHSDDVLATDNALKSLGANIFIDDGAVTIERTAIPNNATVDCKESGSTLRFLLPVAAALGIHSAFTGQGRLLSRPISGLVDALNERGAQIDGLTVNGKLHHGEFIVPANVSSQYITGLLFALPLLSGDSSVIFDGAPVSTGYIDITLDVLNKFGISVEKTACGYNVKGNQKYKAPRDVTVEGDYSGAAFMVALGAICGDVTVKGLNPISLQGDAEIINVLKKFGANVCVQSDCVSVKKSELNAINIDCENIPDLVQILSVVAAFGKGVTILKNVNRLRLKESDRIAAITSQLNTAGIRCDYECDSLFIHGGLPIGGTFSGGDDHRTVMSASVLALGANGGSKVIGCEPVNKSYTEFFNDIIKLGGKVDVNV